MDQTQPKKLLILYILDILRDYSDEDHRLSQKDIADILESRYQMKIDRKAVKRNLTDLIEAGYDIEYSETGRGDNVILSDFYIEREFTDSEIRFLIDALLSSRNVPAGQQRSMLAKLKKLSSKYFDPRVSHIKSMADHGRGNGQLFLTIEILDEAISRKKQVAFKYNSYGIDKKLHPRKNSEGEARQYIINPYQMAVTNGRYYLICNYDKYDNVANYRLDRITDIELLDTPAKPMKKVKGLENGLDLPKHMAEHLYMFAGESVRVVFRFKKYILNDIIDWFGTDIIFSNEDEDEATAEVHVNYAAMRLWAMQYAVHARILEPACLADAVMGDIRGVEKTQEAGS